MVEIKDLGRITVGAYKANFAIYECPVCKRHTRMNKYNVKQYNTQRCNKCKRTTILGDIGLEYIGLIQSALSTNLELRHSVDAQNLVRKYATQIQQSIDSFGGSNITARLRTNKAELDFILSSVGDK